MALAAGKAASTLYVRESRSSMAGALIAASMEGAGGLHDLADQVDIGSMPPAVGNVLTLHLMSVKARRQPEHRVRLGRGTEVLGSARGRGAQQARRRPQAHGVRERGRRRRHLRHRRPAGRGRELRRARGRDAPAGPRPFDPPGRDRHAVGDRRPRLLHRRRSPGRAAHRVRRAPVDAADGGRRRAQGGAAGRPSTRSTTRATTPRASRSPRGWRPAAAQARAARRAPGHGVAGRSRACTNLSGGDRDSVGYFQMRVGIWNSGPYAGYPDDPQQQIDWFLDQAQAVKKRRHRPRPAGRRPAPVRRVDRRRRAPGRAVSRPLPAAARRGPGAAQGARAARRSRTRPHRRRRQARSTRPSSAPRAPAARRARRRRRCSRTTTSSSTRPASAISRPGGSTRASSPCSPSSAVATS